jgi:hypothetical protein
MSALNKHPLEPGQKSFLLYSAAHAVRRGISSAIAHKYHSLSNS